MPELDPIRPPVFIFPTTTASVLFISEDREITLVFCPIRPPVASSLSSPVPVTVPEFFRVDSVIFPLFCPIRPPTMPSPETVPKLVRVEFSISPLLMPKMSAVC